MLIYDINVISFEKKEVLTLVVQNRFLPGMDSVRVQNDITLLCLLALIFLKLLDPWTSIHSCC